MRADEKEWPTPLDGPAPKGTWLALGGHFSGEAWIRNSYGELAASESATVAGVTAISVTSNRFYAVVAPEDESEAALWIGSSSVTADPDASRTHGSFGAIRAAAGADSETLRLVGDRWTLDLAEVQRIYGDRYQEGQAASLLEAVSELQATERRERPTPPTVVRTWHLEPDRGGLFRLYVDGQAAGSSWLVDRNAPRDTQLSELDRVTWLPIRKRDAVKRWTANEFLPGLVENALPDDRVASPFGGLSAWLVEPALDPHAVSFHLWPFFGADGGLILEPGETEIECQPLTSLLEQGLSADGAHKGGLVDVPYLGSPRLHITNRRMVMLGEWRREGQAPEIWGLNLRYEWTSEVGAVRRLYPPKKGLFRAKPREFKDFVYVRCGLPSEAVIEFRLGPADGRPADALAETLVALAAQGPARSSSPPATSAREHAIDRFASYVDEHRGTPIAGAVPVSLPASLCSPAD